MPSYQLHLPFLWPSALLRAGGVRTAIIRPSVAQLHQQAVHPPLESVADPSSPRPAYFVGRTPSKQLPVYHLAKRGGNLHQTLLKKIHGDIKELRNQLQRTLSLKEADITINHLTRHIIIKGWRKPEVTKFLEERRF